MIRSILLASDLGLYASYVFQHSLSLARAYGADLYVVHAVEPMGLFAESVLQAYLDDETLGAVRREGLGSVMADIEERVLEGFREQMSDANEPLDSIRAIRVIKGDPPQVILEQVKVLGADLLVIGSHSHGAGLESPLGRTAARLLQLSEVPVFLVPMLQHRAGLF